MKDAPIISETQRRYSAHHLLVQTAEKALGDKSQVPFLGHRGAALTAITLSALALEALLNAIGDQMVDHWDEFDRLAPLGKLRLVAQALGVKIDTGAEPWQGFKKLFRLRNEIAHAKPQLVKTSRRLTAEQFNDENSGKTFYVPESNLEANLTIDNGKYATETCRTIFGILADAVPADKRLGITGDGWSGSYAIASENDLGAE